MQLRSRIAPRRASRIDERDEQPGINQCPRPFLAVARVPKKSTIRAGSCGTEQFTHDAEPGMTVNGSDSKTHLIMPSPAISLASASAPRRTVSDRGASFFPKPVS